MVPLTRPQHSADNKMSPKNRTHNKIQLAVILSVEITDVTLRSLEVMYSSRWDFWFLKSGCVNNNWRQQQSVFPAPHRKSSSSKSMPSSSNTSSTVRFWGVMGFEILLSWASVTLDRHPIVICAVDVFLGQILRFFVVGVLLSFPHIGHVLSEFWTFFLSLSNMFLEHLGCFS